MFRPTPAQPTLFLTSNLLPGEKLKRLDLDWPGQFRRHVLTLVDEEKFSQLYHADNGRPNTPVRLLIGVLVLKEIFNLTDEEALGRLEFDLRWHVALERTLDDAPCCQKTLHNFRIGLEKYGLAQAHFKETTGKMITILGVSVEKQRLDSTHILSNIARLNRLGLFCETIRVFLKELRKELPEKFVEVPEGLRGRYLKNDGGEQPYQDARKEEAPRRLKVCARDLWRLLERFKQDEAIRALASYGLVSRLFSEQCEIPDVMPVAEPGDADASEPPVAVGLKEPKDISAASLQSPHDPEVTYSGHKGKGYEVQLAETHGNGEKPELFTHVEVTPSCKSDEAAAIPVLEALSQAGLQPREVAADTTYGSAANAQVYEERGT
ncbi:MAG: transposase, partial [Elusimicrobiota bacterium]